MSQESLASWVAQQYQLPESAISAIGSSEDPYYRCLKIPARDGKPAHKLIFSDGLAANYGMEFTLRVSGSPLEDEKLPMMLLLQLLYYREMLDGGAEVNLHHGVPLGGMMPFPWTDPQLQKGDSSALLVEDPVLKHPRIKILGLLCQSPLMKFATATLPNPKVAELLAPLIPDLITNLDTPLDPNQPELAAALKQLAESSPQTPMIHGLMFELRLRQLGQALDLLVGPRWVAPILHAVEQVYGKDAGTVLPGSAIACVNESNTGMLIIRHHDDDGQPVKEGQGRFRIRELNYELAVDGQFHKLTLDPAEVRRLATLSDKELYEQHSAVRFAQIELLAPRSLLTRLLPDAQQRLQSHDFEENPACVFDYSSHFTEQKFRLIPISLAYYENEIAVNDSGEVVKSGHQAKMPLESPGSKELVREIVKYLEMGSPSDMVALSTLPQRLGIEATPNSMLFLAGLRVWALTYQWRFLHPEALNAEVAASVLQATHVFDEKTDGPGAAIRDTLAKLNILGEASDQLRAYWSPSHIQGTPWELPGTSGTNLRDQLFRILARGVCHLDSVIRETCPGPRVSLHQISPAMSSALNTTFDDLYGLDPERKSHPDTELLAREFFDLLGPSLMEAVRDLESSEGRASTRGHHEFYQALMAWMKAPKLEEFLVLRQEIVRSSDYQPYKDPRPIDELGLAVGERRHKDVLTIFEREGISLLLSPEAHMAVTIAHKYLGNSELELLSRWLSKLCGEAIDQSGDGSLDRPYLVLHVNDEYNFLRRHELAPVQQNLVHHGGRSLDVMTLSTGRKIAFDVTDMQNAMFGGSSRGSAADVLAVQAAVQAQPISKFSPKGCALSFLVGLVLLVVSTLGLKHLAGRELAELWTRIEAASKAKDSQTMVDLSRRIVNGGPSGGRASDYLRACKILYPRLLEGGKHTEARQLLDRIRGLSPELAERLEEEAQKRKYQ